MNKSLASFLALTTTVAIAATLLAGSGPAVQSDGSREVLNSQIQSTPRSGESTSVSESTLSTFDNPKNAIHAIHLNLMEQRIRIQEIEERMEVIGVRLDGLEYGRKESQDRFINLLRRALDKRNSNGRNFTIDFARHPEPGNESGSDRP